MQNETKKWKHKLVMKYINWGGRADAEQTLWGNTRTHTVGDFLQRCVFEPT